MIRIRCMGCDGTHDKDFQISRKNGYDCFLLLLIKTPARFQLGNETIDVPSNSFILYQPHTPHYYGAVDNNYINDWMQFEIDPSILSGFHLQYDVIFSLQNDTTLYTIFRLISEEYYSNTSHSDLMIYHLFHALLCKLSYLQTNSLNPRFNELTRLRCEIYSKPTFNWSIEHIVQKLNISKGHFHNIYRNIFNTTCQKDIIFSRIYHAKFLLLETDLTVNEISHICQYNNEEHFMRQFKKTVGVTPSNYKLLNQNNNNLSCT